MVSLWDTITVFSLGAALGGTLSAAQRVGGGNGPYMFAVIAGLAVGVGCVVAVRSLGKRIVGASGAASGARLRVAYAVAFLWLIVANQLGFWIAMVVLRLAGT
jgi:hypothetical protein